MLFEFCIPLHSVRQAQQDLFASKLPQPRVRTPPLPPALGGDAAGASSRAPAGPAGAGSIGTGAAGAGAGSPAGSAGGGSTDV